MQTPTLELSFPREIVSSIYGEYSTSVFCEAVRKIIGKCALKDYELGLLARATGLLKMSKEFVRTSYFVYLSNGIRLEQNPQKIEIIKNQLMLDLALRLSDIEPGISFPLEADHAFSLLLNREIPARFDAVKKDGSGFLFSQEGDKPIILDKNSFWSVTKDIAILEQDKNPFNVSGDHPDETFVAYDLGGIPKEKWIAQFRNAYRIIRERVPNIYNEIYEFLDAIVPHGYESGKQKSSSYSMSPGILYLSYTDEDAEQAEAIIHEVHHTLFNIIQWKYKLINNDDSLKYYSAYRPDARHIRGCFLGLHAFVAVQNFYRAMAEEGGDKKFVGKFLGAYLKNSKVIEVLEKYADLTKEGKLLFSDIKSKYAMDSDFFEDIKKKQQIIYKQSLADANSHLEEVKKRNSVLLY